jgi:hypothetical protein
VTKDHGFSPKRVNLQIEATCDALREKGICPRSSRTTKRSLKKEPLGTPSKDTIT